MAMPLMKPVVDSSPVMSNNSFAERLGWLGRAVDVAISKVLEKTSSAIGCVDDEEGEDGETGAASWRNDGDVDDEDKDDDDEDDDKSKEK